MKQVYLAVALILGCLTLSIALCRLVDLGSIFLQPFQSFFIHFPTSFHYRLDYKWNLQNRGLIQMYTTYNYPTMPYKILVDIILMRGCWILIPYGIEGSNAILEAFGPARTEIGLGMIENGNYTLVIVMSNAIDLFQIHKTDNRFSVEETKIIMGSVAKKSEFEKRLDGFKIEFIGFRNIDDETKDFVLEGIQGVGGVINKTEIYHGGWTAYVYFYYSGNFSSLHQIMLDVAKKHPEYLIGIYSNTGWYSLTWILRSVQPIP